MADVFVRRTTGVLLFVIFLLSLVVVALVALMLTNNSGYSSDETMMIKNEVSSSKLEDEEPKTEAWELEYRIPTTTVPVHYDLYLYPDLDAGTYTGRVAIQISVTRPISYLVTHVKDMNISSTRLKFVDSNSQVKLKKYFEYKPNQFWVLLPDSRLEVGNYSMELEFNGGLEDKIIGFYKSTYSNSVGEKRSIATSKFQPTDARGAFPCFDEPSFKSTFTVTLVKPSRGYIALSNMPEKYQTENSPRRGLTEVHFDKSVPMVTYLACFIVCDFQFLEARTKDNKPFRVYATPEQVSRAEFSRDIGVSILNHFEDYFEVLYPLPKQDMIAVPDFVSGAMEHWGLITYREVNMLYDEQGSSSANQQRVATVVSHELAHMWFGNLVTLSWWDDLWLNEGFASYIEYKGVAQYKPDWEMMAQFLILDLQPVMKTDAKLSSHPIIQTVDHPDQISEIFDSISYKKGASVLRMLDNFMGEENFKKGISNFLKEFKYGNAVTNDLWRHLGETSTERLDIKGIMDTWTRQMGYPVLNVKRVSTLEVEVTQERYLQDPEAVSDVSSPYGYRWDVPVTVRTLANDRELKWFFRDMPTLSLTVPANTPWMKLNADQHGYYRVNYDQAMWDNLIDLLKDNHQALSAADRSNLLDDAFSLAGANKLSYTVPLRLASYLDKETHYIPWKTVLSHLHSIDGLLTQHKAYPLYRHFVLQLLERHVTNIGWQDTGNHLQRLLRPLLLSMACYSGSAPCFQTAHRQMREVLHNNANISPNLRDVVYKYGMTDADYSSWSMLLERYTSEPNAQEKHKLMAGLRSNSKPWIMNRFVEEIRNSSIVRTQDYLSALIGAAYNPIGLDIVWNFIRSEWKFLVDRYTISNRYLGRTVQRVVSRFTTERQLKEAEAWFKEEPEAGSGARARLQAIEEAKKNINWINTHADTLYQWLQDNVLIHS